MAVHTQHSESDEEIQVSHVKGRQYKFINVALIIILGLGSMGYGLSTAIIGTTLAQPTFFEYFKLEERSDLLALIAASVSMYFVGGLFGCIICPMVADRWGRKWAIIGAATTLIITGALLCGSVNIGMFIAFRLLNGLGAFSVLLLTPVLMAEISPPSVRGAMVVVHGIAISLGYSSAQWIGYGFYHLDNDLAWRMPLLFQCFPTLILLVCMPWVPESPRYLLMKNEYSKASQVLARLHNPEEASIELAQINHQVTIDRALDSSWLHMFKKPSYRKRCLLALLIASSSQTVGTLVISNYGPTIYAQLGFETDLVFIFQAAGTTAGLAASPIAIAIVDRLPRNVLLGCAELCCIACVIIEAALDATMLEQNNPAGLKAAVAMVFLFFVFFNGGVDCTIFPYLSEIFPTHLRVKGMALAVAGICVTDILWLELAPTAFANIGWKYYLCFIIPAFVMAIYILLCCPDTCEVPLEEVAAIFGDKDELYHNRDVANTHQIEAPEKSTNDEFEHISNGAGKADV